jgi:hypothetical protein
MGGLPGDQRDRPDGTLASRSDSIKACDSPRGNVDVAAFLFGQLEPGRPPEETPNTQDHEIPPPRKRSRDNCLKGFLACGFNHKVRSLNQFVEVHKGRRPPEHPDKGDSFRRIQLSDRHKLHGDPAVVDSAAKGLPDSSQSHNPNLAHPSCSLETI